MHTPTGSRYTKDTTTATPKARVDFPPTSPNSIIAPAILCTMIRLRFVCLVAGASMTLSGCAQPAAAPSGADEDRPPSTAAEVGPPSPARPTVFTSSTLPDEDSYRAGRPAALMDFLFRHRQTEIPPPGAPIIELDLTELMLDHEVLGAIGSLPDLEVLLLGGTNFDDTGMPLLTGLSRLQLLGLRRTLITDEALLHVAQLSNLQKIYLSDTPLTNSGIAHLAAIDGLRQLALKNTRITTHGLAELQPLTSLERLWLDSTPIGDESVALIARSFPLLEVLFIGHTGVTDAGVAELTRLPGLAVLNLEGTAVTDASVPILAGMRGLVRVQLQGTAMTPAGIENLTAQHPNLKIFTAGTSPWSATPPPDSREESPEN